MSEYFVKANVGYINARYIIKLAQLPGGNVDGAYMADYFCGEGEVCDCLIERGEAEQLLPMLSHHAEI